MAFFDKIKKKADKIEFEDSLPKKSKKKNKLVDDYEVEEEDEYDVDENEITFDDDEMSKLDDVEEEELNPQLPQFDENIPKPPKPLKNHIEEYFANKEGNKDFLISREIFNADKDVDIKTDLDAQEISYITVLMYNNDLLRSKQLKPVYKEFLNNYMRLKISLKRQSRGEFVNINRGDDKTSDVLKGMSDLKSLQDTKK